MKWSASDPKATSSLRKIRQRLRGEHHDDNFNLNLFRSSEAHAAIASTVGYLSFGPIEIYFMLSVTLACARRTGAAARVERRRRER